MGPERGVGWEGVDSYLESMVGYLNKTPQGDQFRHAAQALFDLSLKETKKTAVICIVSFKISIFSYFYLILERADRIARELGASTKWKT